MSDEVRQEQILRALTHVEALKNKTKKKNKHLTDTENRLVVARGKE